MPSWNMCRAGGPSVLAILLLSALAACGPRGPQAAAAPEGVPEWVPIHAGGEATLLLSREEAGATSGTVSLRLPEPPKAVLESYRALLEARGFTVRSAPKAGPGGSLSVVTAFDASGTRGLTLTLSGVDGGTSVLINFREEAAAE